MDYLFILIVFILIIVVVHVLLTKHAIVGGDVHGKKYWSIRKISPRWLSSKIAMGKIRPSAVYTGNNDVMNKEIKFITKNVHADIKTMNETQVPPDLSGILDDINDKIIVLRKQDKPTNKIMKTIPYIRKGMNIDIHELRQFYINLYDVVNNNSDIDHLKNNLIELNKRVGSHQHMETVIEMLPLLNTNVDSEKYKKSRQLLSEALTKLRFNENEDGFLIKLKNETERQRHDHLTTAQGENTDIAKVYTFIKAVISDMLLRGDREFGYQYLEKAIQRFS